MQTQAPSTTTPPTRILRQPTVVERVGVHATTIFRWERAGLFPQRVRLGPNSVGWREHDVEAWLANRASGGVPSTEPHAPPRQTKPRKGAKPRRRRARGGR